MKNAFDKVLGYESEKGRLIALCDMIKRREEYKKAGVTLPRGLLLVGDPGLGKTLLANCMIEECGIKTFVIRKTKPDKDLMEEIANVFEEAKKQPSIILLDDMDKFANVDSSHRDAEEYVAIQSAIDGVCDSEVFVIATVNNMGHLPGSLTRSGRFDQMLRIYSPEIDDADKIVRHYLSDKNLADDVNIDDVVKMVSYESCATLEAMMNYAAALSVFRHKNKVDMKDIVDAVLGKVYNTSRDRRSDDCEAVRKVALHEAGHVVACEVLMPGGVGLASVRASDSDPCGGFIHCCVKDIRRVHDIIISLAGKAAVELYYPDICASGCIKDLRHAYDQIREAIVDSGSCGLGYVVGSYSDSESKLRRIEEAVNAELEKYMFKVKDLLIRNRRFLEAVADEMIDEGVLLHSDIQRIRDEVGVTEVAA